MSLYKLYTKYCNSAFDYFLTTNTMNNQDIKEHKQNESKSDEKEIELKTDNDNFNPMVEEVIKILKKENMKYDLKAVHNIDELVANIDKTVNYGKLSDICNLCFDKKALNALDSACGRCNNLMCGECLNEWYNQCKAGKIILATHLLCPFCKNKPTIKTMKKYNKEICTIVQFDKNLVSKLMYNYSEYYFGWCIKCYRIQQAFERVCGANGDLIHNLDNFVCESCKEEAIRREMQTDEYFLKENFKKCPGCLTATTKTSGCNHITCVCGEHWCYECGKAFDYNVIYDHMSEAHGGWWD